MSALAPAYACPLCGGQLAFADARTCPWCYASIVAYRESLMANTAGRQRRSAAVEKSKRRHAEKKAEKARRALNRARHPPPRKVRPLREERGPVGVGFTDDHPGHPLGPGMPMGRPMRIEFYSESARVWRGESHLQAWMRLIRLDPCSYCGEPVGGTADHIAPKSKPVSGLGGRHSWLNLTGACERCNQSKGDQKLLVWLAKR